MRSRAFGEGHPAIQSSAIGVGQIKARLLKHEIEPTVNKALIKKITNPLRIAELSFLVYCSCFYSE